jgi:hypothetical protein
MLLVVLLIVLSVLFGGFQKGTQVKGLDFGSGLGSALGAHQPLTSQVAEALNRGL